MSANQYYSMALLLISEVLPIIKMIMSKIDNQLETLPMNSITQVIYTVVKLFVMFLYDVCSGQRANKIREAKEQAEADKLKTLIKQELANLPSGNDETVKRQLSDIIKVLNSNKGTTQTTQV